MVGATVFTPFTPFQRKGDTNMEQGCQGRPLWGWTAIGGIRMTLWFLIYIFSKNVNVMNDKERQSYFSRLKKTKRIWLLNAIHDPRLDNGLKGKKILQSMLEQWAYGL